MSEEALNIAEEIKGLGKEEGELYTQMNADFLRIRGIRRSS